jgi:hypothetical protein
MQHLVDRARIPLNDAAKTRYSDVTLLAYGVDGLVFATAKRPDLLIGNWSSPSTYSALAVGSTFPLPDRYFPLVADYVTARAELIDDEHVDNARFQTLLANFENKLVTP